MSKKVCADGLLAELTAADKDLAAAYDIVQSGIYTREHERDEEEVKTGWWCEGGCVDRLDKALSMPLFTLELPVALEIAWSAPGAWFGVPVIAQGVAPLVIAGASRSAATRSLSCPHCTATASNVFRPLFLPSLSFPFFSRSGGGPLREGFAVRAVDRVAARPLRARPRRPRSPRMVDNSRPTDARDDDEGGLQAAPRHPRGVSNV